MFDNLKDSLKNASKKAKETVAEKEVTENMVEDVLWDVEEALLQNNVAYDVIEQIKDDMKKDLTGESVTRMKGGQFVRSSLEDALIDVLSQGDVNLDTVIAEHSPAVILFMGFNGSGKTTTIAKMASRLKNEYDVVLAAGDTFRSAAIDQLEEHGNNLGLNVVKHEYGSDPAAVIYDAVEHAEKEDKDVVLADTAGRSHDDANLMDELQKIVDVNEPDLKILVVDALAGNDVTNQAEQYEAIGFDGIVLTKVDVDKNGGAALSLGYLTGRPIMYLGTGQQYEDLEAFDAEQMVGRLLE
jgi:fused signal recognition particle receptor